MAIQAMGSGEGSLEQYLQAYDGISRNIVFFGPVGVGKTHHASAIIRAFESRHKGEIPGRPDKIAYTITDTAFKVLVRTNALQPRRPEEYNLALNRIPLEALCKSDLLLFDDIGSADPSEAYISNLTFIVDERIKKGRRTIWTTNLTSDKLKEHLGERLFSRVMLDTDIVQLSGPDRRMQTVDVRKFTF